MLGSLNLEVFAFKSNPKNVTSNKAVRNKICLHYVKMVKLMGKERKPLVILYIPIGNSNWPAVDCLN